MRSDKTIARLRSAEEIEFCPSFLQGRLNLDLHKTTRMATTPETTTIVKMTKKCDTDDTDDRQAAKMAI
eukprot:scaffold276_cov132-Cylindrotheca_fusiformis.AAC.22